MANDNVSDSISYKSLGTAYINMKVKTKLQRAQSVICLQEPMRTKEF